MSEYKSFEQIEHISKKTIALWVDESMSNIEVFCLMGILNAYMASLSIGTIKVKTQEINNGKKKTN